MKNLFFIFIILLLYSCGKPASKKNGCDGRYCSTQYNDGSGLISCPNCALFSITSQIISVTLSPSDFITSCQGYMEYSAPVGLTNYFVLPITIGEKKTFVIQPRGDLNTDRDTGGACFPDGPSEMVIEKQTSTDFYVYFNDINKGYIIRKF